MTTQKSFYQHVDLFTLVFWGTIILAFCLRFYDLASKPFHHDESLYSVYCWRFFKGEGYKYDPMMHGPFMFHFQLVIFFLFGVGDFSARIAPALFGTLMVASTYYLKEYIGKIGVLTVALVFTCSPTHLYFSRFMREDIYVAFFTYAAVIFGILYVCTRQKVPLYLAAVFLALMFCEKENSYIHAFIFLTFVVIKDFCQTYLYKTAVTMDKKTIIGWTATFFMTMFFAFLLVFFEKRSLPPVFAFLEKRHWAVLILVVTQLCIGLWVLLYWIYESNRRNQLNGTASKHIYSLIFGMFIFVWIYILLYSTCFTNRAGVLDGLAKSWTYWWNQHQIQRIKGPFHYYVPFILLYELPVFLIAVGGVLYAITTTLNRKIIAVWATVFSIFLTLFYGNRLLPLWLAPTHMEIVTDLILAIYVFGIGFWATLHFIQQREVVAAFFTYWSVIGFLIYSYAGEKVPWLFLHILVPVVLLAGLLINRFFTSEFWCEHYHSFKIAKVAVVVVGILFGTYTLHSTVLLNYYHPANPVETMVYTQTSMDILQMLEVMRDVKFRIGSEEAKKPVIAVQGSAVWPLAWYLRDENGWYHPDDLSETQRPLVVIDWEDREKYRKVFENDYQEIRVKLREWWIPQPGGTVSDWWNYFLYRKIFNPTGSTDVAFYVRKQKTEDE
jgi:uncharacterized protein (TIGR03663 family)